MKIFLIVFSLSRYQQFKDFQRRILVATNLFGRGMDIERVNIAFNYDMPEDSDTYLHRVMSHTHTDILLLVFELMQSDPSISWIFLCTQRTTNIRLELFSKQQGVYSKGVCCCRWPGPAGLAQRAWPSLSCLMKATPARSTTSRTVSRWTSASCQRKSTSPLTVSSLDVVKVNSEFPS